MISMACAVQAQFVSVPHLRWLGACHALGTVPHLSLVPRYDNHLCLPGPHAACPSPLLLQVIVDLGPHTDTLHKDLLCSCDAILPVVNACIFSCYSTRSMLHGRR